MRPFLRTAAAANSMGPLDLVEAVMSTASAPRPPVSPSTSDAPIPGLATAAPIRSARSHLPCSRSVPMTRTPEALSSATVSWPTRPSPTTSAVDPISSLASRTP